MTSSLSGFFAVQVSKFRTSTMAPKLEFATVVRLLFGLGAVLVAACAPLEQKDRGPDRPVDLSHVPEAQPRHEVRTAAGNKSPYTVLGKTYSLMEDETDYRERGIASWYGQKFHGRTTANGEVYDMFAMTAAHKTLPIPSYVRVTNLNNGRQLVVRVNDRGPFHGGRIIDLSYAAAQRLGFASQGTAPVEVEIVLPGGPPPPPYRVDSAGVSSEPSSELGPQKATGDRPGRDGLPVPQTFLQVGAFASRAAAERLRQQIAGLTDYPVAIQVLDKNPPLHRVRIGPVANLERLRALQTSLRKTAKLQAHIVYD